MGRPGRASRFAFTTALLATSAMAQSVSMSGSLGHNALLLIDGKPRNVAIGATVDGVRLIAVSGNDALVEVQGKRVALQLGGAQVNLGGKASEGTGSQIVLTSGSGGHYLSPGSINGKSVRFVVRHRRHQRLAEPGRSRPASASTTRAASAATWAPPTGRHQAYRLTLSSIRVGDVELHNVGRHRRPRVDAVRAARQQFSSLHFQMRQDGGRMTLDKRY